MLGEGILKGLAETAKNFFLSFFSARRLTTVQYPEQRKAPFEATRVFPFLIRDGDAPAEGEDWHARLRCVACQICEKECPPQCIFIEKSAENRPYAFGKPQFYPLRFAVDTSVCMSCQICAEVCPFDAIKMDTQFELSTSDRFGGLLLDNAQLVKSNEYYHEIHPTEADSTDARLDEKAKAEAKSAAAAAAAKAAKAAKAAAEAAKKQTEAGE